MSYREGQRVRFTADQIGLVTPDNLFRFAEPTVGAGDEGTYAHSAPSVGQGEWHYIDVEVEGEHYLAPVREDMFEVIE